MAAIISTVLCLIAEVFQVLDIQIIKGVNGAVTRVCGSEQGVRPLVEIHVIQEVLGMPSIFPIALGLSKNKANLH